LRIFVLGTRGIPDIQGGVEQHCENLYPLIASDKYKVTIFRRKPYIVNRNKFYRNITFVDLPSTRIVGFEAFYHSFLCSVICVVKRPDIVHIHNIGPGFFVPFLKLAGLKVVMTYHSPNYEHIKWSAITRHFLKMSEFISTRFSDKVIFVSPYQREKLGSMKDHVHITNGVNIYPAVTNDDYIRDLGLHKQKYVLAVGRFVEEKGFDLLIRAFSKIDNKDYKLVIAGGSDHETSYSARLKDLARSHNVILTGFLRGEKLQQLFSHARLFVLSSYNEGLPLSLLEAMSYNLPVLASDIPANLQLSLETDYYFVSGNEESLIGRLNQKLKSTFRNIHYNMKSYDWAQVASETISVYEQLV